MNATHSPFVIGAYAAPRATPGTPTRSNRRATRIAAIGIGFALMGYLMALSFSFLS